MNSSSFPPYVVSRIGELASHVAALRALADAPVVDAEVKRAELGRLQQAMRSTMRFVGDGQLPVIASPDTPTGTVDPGQLERLRAEAQKIEAELEASDTEIRRRRDLLHRAEATLSDCTGWLAELPKGTVLEQARTGPTDAMTLGELRTLITELEDRISAARQRVRPASDLLEALETWVAAKAATQRFSVIAALDRPLDIATVRGNAPPTPRQPVSVDPLALACLLTPKAVVAALVAGAGDLTGDNALPDREHSARMAELHSRLDDAERLEESMVTVQHARGNVAVTRRRLIGPEVVLGVRVVAVAAVAAVATEKQRVAA